MARATSLRWLVVPGVTLAFVAAWRLDLGASLEITSLRDDAYYYFAWARSLAAGDGPCVTAGVPTSGVQYLWGVLLAALAVVGGVDDLPRLAWGAGLVLHVATAVMLAVLARGTVSDRIAPWAVGLLHLASPVALTEAQNGQETALAMASLAGLLLAWRRSAIAFVMVSVLAVLARADLWLVVAAFALVRPPGRSRPLAAPALSFAVYVGINLLVAGSWQQDSAAPIPWLFAQSSTVDQGLWWWLRPCLLGGPFALASPVLFGALVWAGWPRRLPSLRWSPLVAVALAQALGARDLEVVWCAAALFALVPAPRDSTAASAAALAMVVAWIAIALLHHVVRHHPRPYYFAPIAVAGAFGLVVLWRERPVAARWLCIVAALHHVWAASEPAEQRTWQREMAMAGTYARDLIGDAAVGAFNAGLVAWHHPGRVVNLDGVVNRAAFEALRASDLGGYLDREAVGFLLDAPVQFAHGSSWPHASGRYFGADFDPARDLVELARFDVVDVAWPGSGSSFVALYRRRGTTAVAMTPDGCRELGRFADGGVHVWWPASGPGELFCRTPSGDTLRVGAVDRAANVVVEVPTGEVGEYHLHEGDPDRPRLVLRVH